MSEPKKIRQGETLPGISESGWNAFVDTTKQFRQQLPRAQSKRSSGGASVVTETVSNETGSDITADFPILVLGESVFTTTDDPSVDRRKIVFKGTTPTETTGIGDIAILQSPAGTGSNGLRRGVIFGPTWCDVDVTDEAHTHATPKDADNTKLKSGKSGALIKVKPTGIGVKRCLIQLGGGIGDHFQLVRGVTTAAVSPSDPAFQITITDKIEQFASDPGSPLWVKAASGGVTLSEGDEVLAGYRENALTFDPGGGDVQVDWIQLLAGSASTPPLRSFVLTANKTLASATATAKFIGMDGSLIGSEVTIYDPVGPAVGTPSKHFSGRVADACMNARSPVM